MKFIHLSDLHLGKRVNEISMLDDQKYILSQILRIIDTVQPDALLISGDVYDKSIPSAEAVTLFDDFLYRLAKRSLPVLIISGNHDSPERLAFGGRLMQSSGIHISKVYDGDLQPITLTDAIGEVHFWLLPFLKPIHVRQFFPEETIESYTGACAAAIKHMPLRKDARNVLLAHQFVTGAATCESETVSVGGTDNVDASVFADFDYVALGHIHKPWIDDRSPMAYAGALEPIDRNDEGIHGYIQGILSEKETKIEFVPFAERSYITLNAEVTPDMTMRQLAESVKGLLGQCGRQNMFQIVIEGFRNVDFELDDGMLMRLGRVLSVRDHSVPDFDFQHLYEENQNNIIGMYIRQISEMDISDELKAKALGYGMKALLETR